MLDQCVAISVCNAAGHKKFSKRKHCLGFIFFLSQIIASLIYCLPFPCSIKECHGLPLINGQNCDPYATVSLVGPSR